MKKHWMASLFLMACSGGGGGGIVRLDASVDMKGAGTGDMAMATSDMAVANKPDLAMGGGGNCTVSSSDYGALGTKKGQAQLQTDMSGNQFIGWAAPIDAQGKPTLLSLELYAGAGAFTGSKTIKTGTFQIAGDEANYATCGVCVLLYTQFDSQAMSIADSYMATGGTVKLTSVNGTLTGTITDAKFEHVQIDPDTFESTPDPSMCKSAITSISFSDAIM